jgi:predicted metal-dependent hydrolase
LKERRDILLIEGKPLHYRVRQNRRARKFSVTVSRDEGVVVVVPRGGALRDVPGVMARWVPWLQEKAEEFECWELPTAQQYASGSVILFRGEPRRLEVVALPPARKRGKVDLEGDTLVMKLPAAEIWDLRPLLERWLRKEAQVAIHECVMDRAREIGLVPSRVIIGHRKTRWGSCSSRETLSFNYRLIMAPDWVLDAVVVHEICHLRHMNHSRHFYALVEEYCPRHQEAQQWLKDNRELVQL